MYRLPLLRSILAASSSRVVPSCLSIAQRPIVQSWNNFSTSQKPSNNTPATPSNPAASTTPSPKQSPPQSDKQQQSDNKQQQQPPNKDAGSADDAPPKKPLSPISWQSVTFLLIAGSGVLIYYQYVSSTRRSTVRTSHVGTPLLGGDFELVDDDGKKVKSVDLRGKYILVYFGFTHCPDICPTELKKMQQALDIYYSNPALAQHEILPIFISIDPRRDTPLRLKEYKKAYDPRMIWLTGSNDDIASIAKKYRVYYSAPDIAEGSDEQYLVDHSIFFYLMDRQGQFMEYFGKSKSAEEIGVQLTQLIAGDNK